MRRAGSLPLTRTTPKKGEKGEKGELSLRPN